MNDDTSEQAPSGSLHTWASGLGGPSTDLTGLDHVHPVELLAEDGSVGFAAEHARRYVATEGQDDGWEGPRPILILYHFGRHSGQLRRTPLLYFEHEDQRLVVGSKGGSDEQPEWCANILARPDAYVRVMADFHAVRAELLDDEERSCVWPMLTERYPMHARYQGKTARQIPLVHLRPVAG